MTEIASHTSGSSSKRHKSVVGIAVLVVLLLAAVGASGWLFVKYRDAVEANPKTVEQRTIQQVTDMIEAPTEKPSVVTVTDAAKLSNKELASRAKNDDKLLLYAQSKRIVIFRPTSGKIVDMLTIRDAVSDTTEEAAVRSEEP